MTSSAGFKFFLYCAIVVALVKPLGWYMTRVFNGGPPFCPRCCARSSAFCTGSGVDERREQHWLTYTVAMLLFHVGGFLIIYGLMRLQPLLPFNPQGASGRRRPFFQHRDLLHHQRNWQNYGGESTLSYLTRRWSA
jgi:K+-transporting ATPase ATPase A chain